MAYTIQIGKPASKEITRIYGYIVENWGFRSADKFYDKFKFKMGQLMNHPHMGRPSKKKTELRRILVAKRNIIYYRVEELNIVIERLYDSHADPQKNPYD